MIIKPLIMKNYIKHIGILLVALCSLNMVQAQNTKADKKAAKLADIKNLVTSQRYSFNANYVLPLGGGGHALTSYYELRISKDTVYAYLPFFGRAYKADYGSIDNGIDFTSTKFTYKLTNKKDGWDIVIVPLDHNSMTDAKGVVNMRLTISSDGYATLQVNNTNRDAISFNGYIEAIKK